MRHLMKTAAYGIIAALAFLVVSMVSMPATASAADSTQITIYVFSGGEKIMGPDGKPHDTVVPSNFVVKAGQPVTITAYNYDESPHSITSADLKLNFTIKPGVVGKDGKIEPTTSTITFTPADKGVYRWYCVFPCDKGHGMWAMGQGYSGPGKEGFMAGFIIVV
jgi:plastocyanin